MGEQIKTDFSNIIATAIDSSSELVRLFQSNFTERRTLSTTIWKNSTERVEITAKIAVRSALRCGRQSDEVIYG